MRGERFFCYYFINYFSLTLSIYGVPWTIFAPQTTRIVIGMDIFHAIINIKYYYIL